MRKILIIAYYWPPSGGGGVQRWLKFVKHLPELGWDPIVVVPKNPEYPVIDASLEKNIPESVQVIKLPIWEPYNIFKKITGRKKEERVSDGLILYDKEKSILEKISLWIRGNFLIPDPRVFWVKPTTRKLLELIPELKPEAIITTGTPHSLHLIGYALKQKTGIPWIADLRDPWSTLDLFDKFYPTKFARNRQKRIEKRVLSEADKIITVSKSWAKELGDSLKKQVEVITNGFDEYDINSEIKPDPNKFVISHIGIITAFRNPDFLWKALNELCEENQLFSDKLHIQIIGTFDKNLEEELSKYEFLRDKISFSGYINHTEVKHRYAESDCLLLLQNRTQNSQGHIPGKVFEYLASGKPILALLEPNSDIGHILSELNAGKSCHFEDKQNIKNSILHIFNGENKTTNLKGVSTFSRKNLSIELGKVIDQTIQKSGYKLSKATNKKKVLIISYYWPPSAGGGVMRWLKMSKYLPELGWQPLVFTPSNPDSSVYDFSLINEIHPELKEIKTPIWEPYYIYRRITGKGENTTFKAGYISEASGGNWKARLSVFLRGNFLIPDPRRFWIKPSIKYLSKFLKANPVDLMVSTGPPHSMHLIALGLKEKFDIPWIADFRDPWTDIDFYQKLKLTKWADRKHRKLEKKVMTKATRVVTVSPSWQKNFEKICKRKVDLIYNGYDHEDFEFESQLSNQYFTISHFGAFNKDRNPKALWQALAEISNENPEFKTKLKIQLIGQTDESILQEIREIGLGERLEVTKFLPHKEAILKMSNSQVLLLPINDAANLQGILPGKMYEYLALKRPILAIGPTTADFAQIITETNSGVSHGFHDVSGIKNTLSNFYQAFNEGNLEVNSSSFEQFSRKYQAGKFMQLMD